MAKLINRGAALLLAATMIIGSPVTVYASNSSQAGLSQRIKVFQAEVKKRDSKILSEVMKEFVESCEKKIVPYRKVVKMKIQAVKDVSTVVQPQPAVARTYNYVPEPVYYEPEPEPVYNEPEWTEEVPETEEEYTVPAETEEEQAVPVETEEESAAPEETEEESTAPAESEEDLQQEVQEVPETEYVEPESKEAEPVVENSQEEEPKQEEQETPETEYTEPAASESSQPAAQKEEVTSTATTSSSKFSWPVASRYITSLFGNREAPIEGATTYHRGIDISAEEGEDISAAGSGTVSYAGYNDAMGNYIVVDHGDGYSTTYEHCSELYAQEGQQVSQGDTIASIGSTGIATGSHLHLGVSLNGEYVDPYDYLDY